MSAIRGMILAAGLGTRMRPWTDSRPKALVEVCGRPLIDFSIMTLAAAGIRDVVVNLHHFGAQVRAHVGDGSRYGIRVHYSPEEPLQGSGGGIRQARPLLGDATFVTLNSDTVIGIDLRPMIAEHRRRGAVASMVLRNTSEPEAYGEIRIAANGRMRKFLRHVAPGPETPSTGYMFTGAQILEPRVFAYMPEGPFSITEITYPRMLAAGERLFGSVFEGPWLTVGTPRERERAQEALRRGALDWPAWMQVC